MNTNDHIITPEWQDPDDALDLSQPQWAEKLDKIPVRHGQTAESRLKEPGASTLPTTEER